jgi:diguanylate cyclase (GGDEF)-like protein/PAS domain S-box-containing protein
LAAIVQSSSDAILSKTLDGVITSWNVAAERLYGYSAEEAVGQHVSILVPSSRRAELAEIIARAAAGTPTDHLETVRVNKAGDEVDVVLSVCPVFGHNGEVVELSTIAHDIGQRKQAERERQWLAAIVESSVDAILSKTLDGVITSWNEAAQRIYGYSAEEAVGQHISIVVPPDRRRELQEILDKVAAGSTVRGLETVRVRKDGSDIEVLLNVWPLFGAGGEVIGASTVTHDVTAEARAVRARLDAEMRLQAQFRRSAFGMVTADLDGTPTAVNPAICELLGRSPDELTSYRWGYHGHPDDAHLVAAMLAEVRSGADSSTGEQRFVRSDGSTVWLQVHITVVRDGADEPMYLMAHVQDVTDRKRVEDEMGYRALHDELTGLPNRALLNDRLDHALAGSKRSGTQVGVVFLDLDGFKNVNGTLGHEVGDRLLAEVGHRLNRTVRPGDTVARFGGDEYAIVCADVTPESMTGLAERVAESVRAPFAIEGRAVPVQASLGITLSRPTSSAQSLLSEADAAMYRAKDLGRGKAMFFDDSLRARAEAMLDGERALRAGIERREIVAHYQPIVNLGTGAVVGLEALARWHKADGGVALPYDFIPLAEDSGLIVALGGAVLSQAVREVATWNAEAATLPPLFVSVNVSARQLAEPHLVDLVTRALRHNDLPAELLHLEVTETAVIEDIAQSRAVLYELRAFGVRLSIDDFGTGYSSLSYLSQLPVNTIKIDRSFVDNLGTDYDTSIISAIVNLAQALNLDCVAEGVETADQRAFLSAVGCKLAQGYLWSPPLSPSETHEWLGSHRQEARLRPDRDLRYAVEWPT